MGLLDGMLGQVGQNVDVAGLAAKLGLPPEMIEKAIAALAQAHIAPGDTVQHAGQATGLSGDVLQQILAALGGENALGQIGGMLGGGQTGGLGGLLGGMLKG